MLCQHTQSQGYTQRPEQQPGAPPPKARGRAVAQCPSKRIGDQSGKCPYRQDECQAVGRVDWIDLRHLGRDQHDQDRQQANGGPGVCQAQDNLETPADRANGFLQGI